MKLGQLASFIDTEFLPPEYREIYQEQLAKLRTSAPAMPWEKVEQGARGGVRRRAASTSCSPTSSRRRSPPPRSARCTAPTLHRRARGRGQDPVPGGRRGARGRPAQRRHDRPPRAGARARARREGDRRGAARAGDGGARLRVRGAEPARPSPAPTATTRSSTSRDVLTRLSRRRVLVTEYVEGLGFEEVKELPTGRAQPLRRDRLPLLLRLDLPPAALQRRPPPRQLHPDGRRPGRLPRLRDDQEARPRADRARAAGDRRRRRAATPRRLRAGAPRPRLRQEPVEARRRAADGARDGGRRLVHGGPRDTRSRRGG